MTSRRLRPLTALIVAGTVLAACGQHAPTQPAPSPAASATAPSTTGSATSTATGSSSAASPTATATGVSSTASATATATPSHPEPPPASWADLGTFTPLWIQPNKGRVAAPGDPSALAVCAPGGVRLSLDGGARWSMVATAGVPAALKPTGYAIPLPAGQSVPPCVSALAAGDSVYAVYAVGTAKYGMPPVYYVAVYTADGGKTWRAVPPPTGFDAGGFGGLSVTPSGAVQAVFSNPHSPFGLVATTDGGATWTSASLQCPAGGGPCLRWGPAPSGTGSCAMHDYPQPIEVSSDGGATWRSLNTGSTRPEQDIANGCDLNELVGLSATRALLVGRDINSNASVRVTGDGGRTWTSVALPALPPGTHPAPGGVRMLPDGALIAVVSGQASQLPVDLLAPGATRWCTVPGLSISGTYTDPATLQPAGGRLIWLEQASASGAPVLKSVALSAVHC